MGKTTLLLQLAERQQPVAIYAAADSPEAAAPGFWERLWSEVEATVRLHGRATLLLDEAHLLPGWGARLKGEFDRARRRKLPIHIVMSGSSALRLTAGSRESLAGRFERLTLSHWSPASLQAAFGVERDAAVDMYVLRGAYPGAVELLADPARWTAYVRDSIIEPAIGRDVLALGPVRKPSLLRQVFAVCVTSPAQIVSLQKLQGQLQDRGALETIAQYLGLLEDAYLVAALAKFSIKAARRRAAPPKLITLDNALLAAAHPHGPPDPELEPGRFGAWLENACLARAWNAGQQLTYWREEPLEVDGILDGTWGSWALEIKSGAVAMSDLRGLQEFTRRFPDYRPLLISGAAGEAVAARGDVGWVDWRKYLEMGLSER